MSYYFSKTLGISFDEALMKVTEELKKRGQKMSGKEAVVGYYTEDGNIYCVECVNKEREIMKKIEQAITVEDSEQSLYFCSGCDKEIK